MSKFSYQFFVMLLLALVPIDYLFVLNFGQAATTVIAAAQKLYFKHPRPYFLASDLSKTCKYIDYGAPSAHTMIGCVCYGTTWAVLMKGTKASATTQQLTFWLLLLPMALYIPASRFYVGQHSYD